jgi:hypothetical protein
MEAKHYKFIILIILVFFAENTLTENRLIINFESPSSLNQEVELIQNIANYNSVEGIENYLTQQNWIDHFLIKSSFFGKPIQVFIKSKRPKYIWKEKFYIDSQVSIFAYDGGHPDLIRLNMPLEYLTFWIEAENQFINLCNNFSLNIQSVSFQPAIGWYLTTDNALRINLGDDLSNDTHQKLSLTLKYMFENNLTPSIIDLRYKAGAALNYGK